VRFLAEACGLSSEHCRVSPQIGEGLPGVEVRALVRLEVDGSFGEGSTSLLDEATLDILAAKLNGRRTLRAIVEIGIADERLLARRRCSVMQAALLARCLPRSVVTLRVVPDCRATACFYIFDEIPPMTETH
jgi:hypothetical protein